MTTNRRRSCRRGRGNRRCGRRRNQRRRCDRGCWSDARSWCRCHQGRGRRQDAGRQPRVPHALGRLLARRRHRATRWRLHPARAGPRLLALPPHQLSVSDHRFAELFRFFFPLLLRILSFFCSNIHFPFPVNQSTRNR